MRCTQFGMWKSIGFMIILSYCQALKQEIGEECTNNNGIVGFCQFKSKCSKDTDLGAVCNSERTIICCSGNVLRGKQYINSSNDKNEDQSVQSRFGFIPDFFHTPILPQNPTPNNNFFNHQQNLQFSNFVGNVLHQNLNTMQFVEDKPYQNIEQDVVTKPNKKKTIPTRPTNEYGYQSSNNNQKPNIKNIFNDDQSTKVPQNYYTPNYESSRPHQNQNSNNNYPNYQSSNNYNPNYINQRPNQSPTSNHNNRPNYEVNQNYNNNNNYPSSTSPSLYPNQYTSNNQLNPAIYETNQNYYSNSVPQRPNQNVNRPYSEPNPSNQNNNNRQVTTQRPNYNQQINTNQPYHGPYQSNNNKFDTNPNYYTNTQKPQTNYNSGNYEYNSQLPNSQTNSNGYEGNKRPNQSSNTHLTSSSILFPDDSTDDTKFTTTTKKYFGYQNGLNENKKRISEIKCEEYSKPLTTTISALPLSIDTAPKPISIEKCDSKSVGLIVGGTKAELGEFPHMVAIGFRTVSGNPWNCGGTLISERFVLTAAHCTHSALGNPVRVRLGELNLQKNNDGANPVDYVVEEIIVHPNYVSTLKYNDIALLRLNKIVKFNNHIRPACLYNNNNIYFRKVTATGWGSIEYGDRSSDDLLKVDLDIIENRRCNKLYEAESKTSTLNKGIIDSMICAGDLAGGHDTCLGDSGGPLVIRSEKNVCIFNLIGITSFGKFCATENSPGVYTKVSSFLPWIEQIVWS